LSEAVLYDLHSHVARITLNRPEVGNVVNLESLDRLYRHLAAAEADPECRAIVVEGRDGVFSRGMDFGFMLDKSERDGIDEGFAAPYQRAVLQIRNSKKPVVAAVDGEVLAGGTGIALACDIVIATERSTFGLSEVLFGIIPAYVLPLLLERVSFKRARYMVLASKKLTAGEALAFGAFDEVVPNDGLEKALTGYLKRLLFASPDALAQVKRYTDTIFRQSMDDAMVQAARQLSSLLGEKKNTDAIKAFMEGEMMPWTVRYKRRKTGSPS
jgi:polyketide biosynthesis enoyl-CoA hydratase PksH